MPFGGRDVSGLPGPQKFKRPNQIRPLLYLKCQTLKDEEKTSKKAVVAKKIFEKDLRQ